MFQALEFPDDANIIAQTGPALFVKGKYGIGVNFEYFATKMARTYCLVFYSKNGWFVLKDNGWNPIRVNKLKEKIRDLIQFEIHNYYYSPYNSFNLIQPQIPSRTNSIPPYDLINKGVINEILEMLKIKCDRGETIPPLAPNAIPVRNGILRWNEEKQDFDDISAYTPDDMFFHTLEVDYDPEAKSDLLDKVLSEILPDSEDRCVVQEFMGAVLFSENRTRKFMSFTGESGSGKSVLVGLLSKIMTPVRNFDLEIKDLTSDYGLSALTTQTLITVSEAGKDEFRKGSGAAADFIKKIVGRDFFQTKLKNRNERISHDGVFSLIYVSNHALKFEFESDGEEYRSRLLPIVFNKRIENPNLTLGDELLQNHRSAFFNWLLDGARRVRRNNLVIELSPEQIKRREQIIITSQGVEHFVKNYVVRVRENGSGSFTSREAYERYSENRDVQYDYLDEDIFYKQLNRAMVRIFRKAATNTVQRGKVRVRGYRGFKLVAETSTQAPETSSTETYTSPPSSITTDNNERNENHEN